MIFYYEQLYIGFDNSKRRVLLSRLIISRLQLNNNYSQQFKYTIYDSFIIKKMNLFLIKLLIFK